MRHDAAEVFPLIPRQSVVEESPRRLAGGAAPVAGEPDDIEGAQSLINVVGPKEVDQMDVVMNENEDCRILLGFPERDVVERRQAGNRRSSTNG